jgi:hypothetical protein
MSTVLAAAEVDWASAVAAAEVVRIRWFGGVIWQLHQSTVTGFPA